MAFQLISKVGVWTFVTKENFVNESLYGQKAALQKQKPNRKVKPIQMCSPNCTILKQMLLNPFLTFRIIFSRHCLPWLTFCLKNLNNFRFRKEVLLFAINWCFQFTLTKSKLKCLEKIWIGQGITDIFYLQLNFQNLVLILKFIFQCSNGGCLIELAQQLAVIMVGKQIINNAQEILIPKMKAWWHNKKVTFRLICLQCLAVQWNHPQKLLIVNLELLFTTDLITHNCCYVFLCYKYSKINSCILVSAFTLNYSSKPAEHFEYLVFALLIFNVFKAAILRQNWL